MYLEHYGLDREPFHITPDPYFFYLSPSHKESLASLIYGLKNRKGFVALTGEVGLGKTTVVRAFLNKWSSKAKIKTVFVFNPNLSFKGLLLTIYSELGLEPPVSQLQEYGPIFEQSGQDAQDQVFELVQGLHEALIQEYQNGYNIILVIDEAQNMPLQTLENLRMLSNLETSRDKLLQIFLIGQTELDKILDRKELRQLRQRIAVRATIRPLSRKQSKDYILHRLRKAGADKNKIFTRGALRRICKYSQGVPRKINILADNALITGFGYGRKTINARIVKEVQADLEGRKFRPRLKFALAAVLLLLLVGTGLWFSPYKNQLIAGLQDVSPWELPSLETFQEDPAPQNSPAQTEPAAKRARQSSRLEFQPLQPASQDSPRNKASKQLQDFQVLESAATRQEPENELRPEQDAQQEFPGIASEAELDREYPLPKQDMTPENIYIHHKLAQEIPAYSGLSKTRQQVLIRMARQTSIEGLLSFKRMLAALEKQDFTQVAKQMVHSRWARSVGEEAYTLAEAMREDELESGKD